MMAGMLGDRKDSAALAMDPTLLAILRKVEKAIENLPMRTPERAGWLEGSRNRLLSVWYSARKVK